MSKPSNPSDRKASASAWRRREKDRRAGFIGLSVLVHGVMATMILIYGQKILQIGGGGQDGSSQEEFGQSGVSAGLGTSAGPLTDSALEFVELGTATPKSEESAQPTDLIVPALAVSTSPDDVVVPQAKQETATTPQKQELPETSQTRASQTNASSKAAIPVNKSASSKSQSTKTSKAPETVSATIPVSKSQLDSQPEGELAVDEPPQLMANPPDVEAEPESEFQADRAEPSTQFVAAAVPVRDEDSTQTPEQTPEAITEKVEDERATPLAQRIVPETPDKAAETQTEVTDEASTIENVVAPLPLQRNESASTENATTSSTSNTTQSPGAIATRGESAAGQESGQVGGGGDPRGMKGPITGAIGVEIRDASELAALPGNPKPSYPAQDRLRKYEGKAVLVGRVGADGRMSQVLVERSSGSKAMDSSAIEAFKRWRYRPGQQSWVRQPFQFRLIGEATEIPARLGQNSSYR